MIGRTTKERLLLTAERLFASRGIDGVSLRQIAADAGARDNTAVQYHFGSKEGLIQAILEYRLPGLIERRRLLAARAEVHDVRAELEAHLLPVVDLAEGTESSYLMFIEQLQCYSVSEHPFNQLPPEYTQSQRDFGERMSALLSHIPEPLRRVRIEQAMTICVHASADRERARKFATRVAPYALHVNALFDGLVGFLMAPASDATLATLATLDATDSTTQPIDARRALL